MVVKLSKHFTLQEMTESDFAIRNNIANTPDDVALNNLKALCVNVLEPLRTIVKRPVHVNSGYRSPELNAALGGAKNSQHMEGKAADIVVPGLMVDEVFAIVLKHLQFDQCIHEFGRWVHVSWNGEKNRKQILWAVKENGQTKYLSEKPM